LRNSKISAYDYWPTITTDVTQSIMAPQTTRHTLSLIFLSALAIRWGYDFVLYLTMGEPGLRGVDSYYYLQHCRSFAEQVAAGSIHGWQWLGIEPVIMPIPTWILASGYFFLGPYTPLAYVLTQGIVDAGTCILIFRLAQAIDPRFAKAAGVAACINPTQIVLAGFVYTDSLFVFFTAMFLAAAARWLRGPSWPLAVATGIGLAGAAWSRIVIAPWIPALIIFLVIWVVLLHRERVRGYLAQVATMGAIAAVFLGAISLRNESQFGTWSLTSETGYHLFGWIVPLVEQAQDGTPWAKTYDRMMERRRQLYPQGGTGPFDESEQFTRIAKEEIAKLRAESFVKAWIFGAAINLASPAIILSPPILALPKTGFYATPGRSMLEKIWNFLFRSDNALYAWTLNLGVLGVIAIRLIQLRGAWAVLADKKNLVAALMLAGWVAFILLVNGPIASPKYRLPIEPVLAVLTGAGWCALRRPNAGA